MTKDFYCYGFFKEYIEAKQNNDIKKCADMQFQCYNQFMGLAHKMKWDLVKRLQKTACSPEVIYEMTSNYENDIYPELIKAMDCVKIEKIPKKKNKKGEYTWNFYAAYWGYLSVYNRDTVAHYIKKNKNEFTTDFRLDVNSEDSNVYIINNAAQLHSKSPETLLEEKIYRNAFWKAVDSCMNSKFNSIQKSIWNLKERTETRLTTKDICNQLNITPKVYNKEMKSMKEVFKYELSKYEN